MLMYFSNVPSITRKTLAGLLIGAVAAVATPAAADDSGSARISVGGKLRLESRYMMSEACNIVYGRVDGEASAADLKKHIGLFDQMIEALRNGDMALALQAPETQRRVLAALDGVVEDWVPLSADLRAVAEGRDAADAFQRILAQREGIVDSTGSLLAILSGTYSSAEKFSFGAVLAVNIVDRQQVLLEEMALDECVAASGLPQATESAARLEENVGVFAASMDGLMKGQAEVGLMAPPTDGVRGSLERAAALWVNFRPMLEGDAGAGEAALEARVALERELTNARLLYLLATSSQPDLYRIPLETYAKEQLERWLLEPQVILALRTQNDAHRDFDLAKIEEMDQTWRAARKGGDRAIITEMMARPLSELLLRYQTATNGIVTEVFVMDDKGLNVGQSAVTSDLWQGDEDKWQQTYAAPGTDYHVSEVEFDESTGFYQVQVSMSIADPVTQEKLGAVTFGVNIQSLL
ncbi:MAG: type IV pili methyl-accepting chemotaxis transducer N-terminal domain-containing protein [Pseudomonadota bacterium]